MADKKTMVALQSISQAAGLAVACADADADEHSGQSRSATKRVPASAETATLVGPINASADMTWAEPKFRDTFEIVAPIKPSSPKYVLTTTLAQWLTSRAGYKTS
ncbi:MAG: hypothetical protein SH859_16185 [Hyphomicrobium aestuarii]|nr:hypothetical protein [Hyphomicrobium aestuarii]